MVAGIEQEIAGTRAEVEALLRAAMAPMSHLEPIGDLAEKIPGNRRRR